VVSESVMFQKKIILYVGGFELPDKNAAAQRVLVNSKALRDFGYCVIFLGISHSREKNHNDSEPKCFEDFIFFETKYPTTFFNWVSYSIGKKRVEDIISMYNPFVEGIILYNYPAIASFRINKLAKKYGIRIIADCTEWYDYKRNNIIGLIKYIDNEIRMRFIYARFDAIIAISRYIYNFYSTQVPTFYLPPLVDINESKWSSIDDVAHRCFTVAYAGSPGRKDKLNTIVQAVSQFAYPIQLRIIGISKSTFIELHPEFVNYNLEKIFFLGRLSHKDTLKEIKNADYTCFFRDNNTASQAGFPTKFVESISSGIPVITNKTSDIPFFCKKLSHCILIENPNLNEILQGLEKAYFCRKKVKNNTEFDYRNYFPVFEGIVKILSNN